MAGSLAAMLDHKGNMLRLEGVCAPEFSGNHTILQLTARLPLYEKKKNLSKVTIISAVFYITARSNPKYYNQSSQRLSVSKYVSGTIPCPCSE